jgi:hypothetical protein
MGSVVYDPLQAHICTKLFTRGLWRNPREELVLTYAPHASMLDTMHSNSRIFRNPCEYLKFSYDINPQPSASKLIHNYIL